MFDKVSVRHLRHRRAIDEQLPRSHLHGVAGQANDALDEVLTIDGMAKDNDIATLGLAPKDTARRSGTSRTGRNTANSHRPSC